MPVISLEALHSVMHVTLSFQSASPDFSLAPKYLQSLMMLVVLGLGAGFGMLVLLAVYVSVGRLLVANLGAWRERIARLLRR